MSHGRFSRTDRADVLAHVDLAAVLDSLSGCSDRRGRWHCPDRDHPDEHPSVTVHTSADGTQRWRCWSAGHGGTAIDAVIAAYRVDPGQAIRWLADHYGSLPIPDRPPAAPLAAIGNPDPAVGLYAGRAAKLLWTPAGRPQREWLADRGLGDDVLRANRLGADPGRRYLPRPAGLPAGWPAVVFPSLTVTGEVAYLQARYLHPPPHRSKYDNPSARLAANPRLAWTVPVGPLLSGVLLVCEGTADALVAAQAGIRSVGVLGAAYPDRRIADGIIAGRSHVAGGADSTVVVCFDDDAAGRAGGIRLIGLLDARDVVAVNVTPPAGLDLTGWALRDAAWQSVLAPWISGPEPTARVLPPVASSSTSLGLAVGGIG